LGTDDPRSPLHTPNSTLYTLKGAVILKSYSESYKVAGVDVTAGYKAVELMKEHVKRTTIPGVISGLGGFGGLFDLSATGVANPVLVSGTDGVGTKLKLAFIINKHDTVGIDCVAMCVNDIVCSGAKPLFFLDYIAVGKNIPEKVATIVSGVAEGCVQAGCALVGGETAEMPGFYPEDEYDLAGFCVGVVDKHKIIDGSKVKSGNALIGIASSGVHSNGFSLIRRIFSINEDRLSTYIDELSSTLGEVLLTPTKIYVKSILSLIDQIGINGASHITGGGFYENIPRMLPPDLKAVLKKGSFPTLPIFNVIARLGKIPEHDMFNTFNMGIGMCVAVDADKADVAVRLLNSMGEKAYIIGEVAQGENCAELI
jgi:phosphoribosylformylglycinamidine cyclo-ligase